MKRINKNMMNRINALEKLELSNNLSNVKTENDYARKRAETLSSINSDDSSIMSNLSANTTQSKPFK